MNGEYCQLCNKLHSFSIFRHFLVVLWCDLASDASLMPQYRPSVDYYFQNGSCLLVVLSVPSAPSIGRFCTGVKATLTSPNLHVVGNGHIRRMVRINPSGHGI
jgi:hypothetical protein